MYMKIREKRYNFTFQAGLTKQMQREIASCNPAKISSHISKMGINTDFKNNKTIAWCSLKCAEIIKNLNRQFNLSLALPKGIFVEDFRKLNIANSNATGLCNITPTILNSKNQIIVPEKTIFFNEYPDNNFHKGNAFWENIDHYSDLSKSTDHAPTDFFLNIFLHEFSHAIHLDHLISILGGENFIKLFEENTTPEAVAKFKNKYWHLMYYNICTYASSHPMEAIACDLTKRISEILDKNTLLPKKNFIKNSPYREYSLIDKLLSPLIDSEYNRVIRNLWNGNFK